MFCSEIGLINIFNWWYFLCLWRKKGRLVVKKWRRCFHLTKSQINQIKEPGRYLMSPESAELLLLLMASHTWAASQAADHQINVKNATPDLFILVDHRTRSQSPCWFWELTSLRPLVPEPGQEIHGPVQVFRRGPLFRHQATEFPQRLQLDRGHSGTFIIGLLLSS